MKNTLISKVENFEYNALGVEDINLGSKVFELYYKKDLIRPPRLFYIPKEEEVKKAIVNVARGDDEVRSLDSLDEDDY